MTPPPRASAAIRGEFAQEVLQQPVERHQLAALPRRHHLVDSDVGRPGHGGGRGVEQEAEHQHGEGGRQPHEGSGGRPEQYPDLAQGATESLFC